MQQARQAVQAEHELAAALAMARRQTDALFALVRPEALYDRPIPERHRIVFYLGHFEAFDWNLIGRGALGRESFHQSFDQLFAFGIDPTDGGVPNDQARDWPRLEEILRYNERVREAIDACLRNLWKLPPCQPGWDLKTLFQVAIEHRLMHAETFAYMLHQLPPERKIAQTPDPPRTAPTPVARMVEIPAGPATLGLARAADSPFGWDNEFAAHIIEVPAFAIDPYNVTNGQYAAFLRAGGYEDRSLWSAADWEWKTKAGTEKPLFWVRRGDRWFYRTMFREIPLPLDWPVYVSHAEASAYARWVGKALPTEAQFHRAAYGTPDGEEREFPWGNAGPESRFGNFDFRRWDPTPVGAHPAGNSAFGVTDLVGNGWEWTSTVFGPFPDFQAFPFYPGYSANFFDGKHYVMKGGSARTAAALLRRTFRNWFQTQYPYVYAAFRCVEN